MAGTTQVNGAWLSLLVGGSSHPGTHLVLAVNLCALDMLPDEHLHGVQHFIFGIEHELDAAVGALAQVLDDHVLVHKHVVLHEATCIIARAQADARRAAANGRACAQAA
eukprot:244132-Chlamydomonas_euryale.AAC.8